MTTRRQRQSEAESRRKELVEQLERDRERVKKASEQVREFGEACRGILGETSGGCLVPEELQPALEEMLDLPIDLGEKGHEMLRKARESRFGKSPTIEITNEASSEATEILNEAAEDEMVEKFVDELIGFAADVAIEADEKGVDAFPIQDFDTDHDPVHEISPDTNPETDSPPAAERQDDLSDEQRPDAKVSGDADKATPSGDGWE